MTTAEEMFKELGFTLHNEAMAEEQGFYVREPDICYVRWLPVYKPYDNRQLFSNQHYQVIFFFHKQEWNDDNFVRTLENLGDAYSGEIKQITTKIICAITRQMKELGWVK